MTSDGRPQEVAARSGILATLLSVAEALEAAQAPYLVGGSLASSLQGIPRSTQDADLVADLATEGVVSFVKALGGFFYADEERICDGIARGASFNVIDLRNGFKADIYLAGRDAFAREQFARTSNKPRSRESSPRSGAAPR